jgi:hypothetical protein
MAPRPRKLLLPEVQDLISTLLAKGQLNEQDLLTFAQVIHGGPFKEPPPAKVKPLTATAAKKSVLAHFECGTVPQLKKCQAFLMQMGSEDFGLPYSPRERAARNKKEEEEAARLAEEEEEEEGRDSEKEPADSEGDPGTSTRARDSQTIEGSTSRTGTTRSSN